MTAPLTHAQRCQRIRESPEKLRQHWQAGVLWWLLDEHQHKAYLRIRRALKTPFARFVLKWARRTGKTHLLLVIVLEECIRNAGHRYNVAAASKESLAEFVWPAVYFILETCPQDLRPWIQEQRGRVTWDKKHGKPRGPKSYIVLAGCNDRRSVERLRGPKSNGNVLEEIGAMPDSPGLGYVQTSILKPQILTTKGWTLMAGTPPSSAGHEAASVFVRAEAEAANFSYATLYDNPRLTAEDIRTYLKSDADEKGMTVDEYLRSPDYRREWMALVETDPTYAVLPDCTTERMTGSDGKPPIIRELPDTPLHVDRYVAMDLGFHPHFTGVLLGYWDYPRQTLVIERELLMQRLNDTRLAEMIGGKWTGTGPSRKRVPLEPHDAALAGEFGLEYAAWGENKPYLRVADNNNPSLLAELASVHGLAFTPSSKDDKDTALTHVNRWIRLGKIAVHPRCKALIAQMQAAVWNRHRTEFAEMKGFGHFDLVDALVYMVRAVRPNVNRMPRDWGFVRTEQHWGNLAVVERSPDSEALRSAFGGDD